MKRLLRWWRRCRDERRGGDVLVQAHKIALAMPDIKLGEAIRLAQIRTGIELEERLETLVLLTLFRSLGRND